VVALRNTGALTLTNVIISGNQAVAATAVTATPALLAAMAATRLAAASLTSEP